MTDRNTILEEWEYQKGKWGLEQWQLKFSKSKRSLGYCDCRKKVIYLSDAYMKTNELAVMKDTLLHEIAHAIQYINYGRTDHGNEWKKIAADVGCKPERCASADQISVPRGKYVAVCPSCRTATHFYRKIKRKYSCRICSKDYNREFKLSIMSIDEYEAFY